MAILRPFKALRPQKDKAAQVAAVPYDVVSTAEARQLAAGNPLSFLHTSRAEIDLPDATDPYSAAVYEQASRNFHGLERDQVMLVENAPALYLYRLRMGDHEQTGIAACCSINEYDSDLIRKHERTRKDKEDDRTRHMIALGAQTGPVFLTYRDRSEIDEIVATGKSTQPLYDFVAPDHVQHTVWKLSPDLSRDLTHLFENVPMLYIADGHHRAASASRAARQLRAQAPPGQATVEFEYFLAVIFPAGQLRILAYNRVVKGLNGLDRDAFLKALAERFTIHRDVAPGPSAKGQICMYLDGQWYSLTARAGQTAAQATDPTSSLDVSVLEKGVLDPILGIKDIRTDKRIDFVGGIKGPQALAGMVDDGRATVAFSMYPVSLDDLMAIADSGQIMPPKSTWFEPKLRDGLLIHLLH
jgi:uncharacterized protein (DUF1015 family)